MKTYTADDIASYFLAKADADDDRISNLKLQKLCYYAQGIIVALRGVPLFADPIEAWTHGPVVPSLYHKYKSHGANGIPPEQSFDLSTYAPEDQHVLNDVVSYYGQYSAWRLREMTHNEAPWRNNFGEFGGRVIPLRELGEFFAEAVSGEYREGYERIAKAAG